MFFQISLLPLVSIFPLSCLVTLQVVCLEALQALPADVIHHHLTALPLSWTQTAFKIQPFPTPANL